MVHDSNGGGGRRRAGPEGEATWLPFDKVEALFRSFHPTLELGKTGKSVIDVYVRVGSNPGSDSPGPVHGLGELRERDGRPSVLRCGTGSKRESVSTESVARVVRCACAMHQEPAVRRRMEEHLAELMGDLGPPDMDIE